MSTVFNERLSSLRIARGLSQAELSIALDLPDSTIRRYETDKSIPKRERLELIANFFNVSVDYLIGRTDTDQSRQNTQLLTEEESYDLDEYLKRSARTFRGIELSEDGKKQIIDLLEVLYRRDLEQQKGKS